MNVYDYIILGIVALLVLGAVSIIYRQKRSGQLCSSCHTCSGCPIKGRCQKVEVKTRNCH